jgi:diguanylate cyclase (GGDEF)-like protein/PAS domain S-box-containing protein
MGTPANLRTLARTQGYVMLVGGLVALVRLIVDDRPIELRGIPIALDLIGMTIGALLITRAGRARTNYVRASLVYGLVAVTVAIACLDVPYGSGFMYVWLAPIAFLLGTRFAIVLGLGSFAGLGMAFAVQAARGSHVGLAAYVGWWLAASCSFFVVGLVVRGLVQDLAAAELRFTRAFELAPVGMSITTIGRKVISANQKFVAMSGRTEAEIAQTDASEFVYVDDRPQAGQAWLTALAGHEAGSFEGRMVRPDGSLAEIAVVQSLLRADGEDGPVVLSQIRDVSAEHAARDRAAQLAARQLALIGLSREIVGGLSLEEATTAAIACLREALGRPCRLAEPGFAGPCAASVEVAGPDGPALGTLVVDGPKDTAADEGPLLRAVATLLTGCAQREAVEQRLRHQSLHDPLTGLPNRALLLDRLQHALARGRRDGTTLALLFLDLDDFKNVNDSLGHEAGDRLLRALAPRLEGELRASDSLARLGGDEFVALCEDVSGPDEALTIAQRLQSACLRPVHLGDAEFHPSASIGIAVAGPGTGHDADALLRDADLAMYRAKGTGKRRAALFDVAMRDEAVHRVSLTNDLSRAVERGQLELWFQPLIALQQRRVHAAEALIRWQHPEHGLLGPNEFIPLAEENGRIVEIGRWVIDEAARHAALWPQLVVGFNVSRVQLATPGLVEAVVESCERWGTSPTRLVAEVTESGLATDPQTMRRRLDQLVELGVDIALDDFGKGHSSLSAIGEFPLHAIKLDRAFLAPVDADPTRWALIQTMVELGERLGLGVAAEGIEDEAHAARLTQMGCRYGQGYLYSPPVPSGRLLDVVRRLDADLAGTAV